MRQFGPLSWQDLPIEMLRAARSKRWMKQHTSLRNVPLSCGFGLTSRVVHKVSSPNSIVMHARLVWMRGHRKLANYDSKTNIPCATIRLHMGARVHTCRDSCVAR